MAEGLKLVSENPWRYIDKKTGKDVPLRKLIDLATGEAVVLAIEGDCMHVLHVPAKLSVKTEWQVVLKISPQEYLKHIDVTEKARIKSVTAEVVISG